MSTIGTPRRERLFRKFGKKCFYCGIVDPCRDYNVDHVVPLALGGTNQIKNMVVACEPCNSKKKNRPPRVCEMFALERTWGSTLIPRTKWEALESGEWIPLADITNPQKAPARKQRLWMKNPHCCKCGTRTSLTRSGAIDECCMSNDNPGAVYRIWCLGCIRSHYSIRRPAPPSRVAV